MQEKQSVARYDDSIQLYHLPPITIDKIPGHDLLASRCQVTINIPWETAKYLQKFITPLLHAIDTSIDHRTEWEKKRDNEQQRYDIHRQQRYRAYLSIIHKALRRVFKESFDYHEFMHATEEAKGYHYEKQSILRGYFCRIQIFTIEYRLQHGWSVDRIAKHYGTTTSNIYRIKKQNRRALLA